MIASIIVDIVNIDLNKQFDYMIPSQYEAILKKGMRVVVPFGGQLRLGYVISIFEESDKANRYIEDVLDVVPTVNDETFMLIDYLYQETHQIYASIFETVVPNQIHLKYQKLISLIKPEAIDDDDEFLRLFNSRNEFRIAKNNQSYDYKIRKYLSIGAIEVKQLYEQKVKDKLIKVYQYNDHHMYQRIDRYHDMIARLNQDERYIKQNLLDIGFSDSNIKTLVKNDVFIQSEKKIERDVKHIFELKDKEIILTKEQVQVYQNIRSTYGTYQKYLLKGVTGSGKTEIYLNIIKDMIKEGKQVLLMVPEITLIAPMAQRLKSRFDGVDIYHSALSQGERLDAYMHMKEGSSKIVLGTRSAVFLPFNDLGCIIIDESHDQSYVQTDHVYYDVIDVSKLRANFHQIPLILGSATPKISRYYEALNGSYELLRLDQRPFGIKQPKLTLIDMKKELTDGNTSMFSIKLQEAIKNRLSAGEQSMILFNRKGYAPFVMCRTCGYVPTCPSCGIALTYYKEDKMLKCHYCGHHETFDDTCHTCHSKAIKEVGVGIELVERMLKKTFPQARILRMDANMTKTKGSHEVIWHEFKEEKADILLGTQMIAKGLDFPKVTLVAVLMADLLLRIPSYQAAEQAYTLLSQVSGRSGRMLPGEVLIQGYDINHYAVMSATKSYEDFYKEAIYDRKISRYEPFMHVSQIVFEGVQYLKTYQDAFRVKKDLESLGKSIQVLGPISAYIKKHQDRFRFVMTLKYPKLYTEIFNVIDAHQSKDLYIKFYPNQEVL